MLRIAILVFISLGSIFTVQAQIERARSWIFGQSIGIQFQAIGEIDTLSNVYIPPYPQYEGTATYNDSEGNLLYYVLNGRLIGNDHKPINNNFYIGGSSSASQANIITSLNDSVFHIFGSTSGFNYYYSCFDRTTETFKTLGKSLIYRASEAQALVNHQNGKWQWVVCHSRLGDTLYSYLITDDGLETCPVISHAGPFYNDWYPGQGNIKFSSDGKYLVFTTWSADMIVFCSFNSQTGEIQEIFKISEPYPYGLEISNNKLYVGCNRPNDRIFSFSILKVDSANVIKSKTTLFDTSLMDEIGQLQTTPQGVIYVSQWGQNYLGVIENEKYNFTKPLFGTKKCYGGFPSFNASYFHTPALNFTYTRNCNNNTFIFKAIDTILASSWKWQYSKGNNSFAGNGKQTSFTFTDTGIWQVRCIATNGNRNDTVIKNITILNPMKSEYLGEDILLPLGANVSGSIAGPNGMHCNHWQKLGDTAEKLGNTYMYHDTGTYVCKATNTVFCNYIDTIKVQVCDSFARAATIDRSGDSLFTKTFAVKYQWYLNDTAINGATKSVLKLNQKGVYKLRTWNAANCDSFSTTFDVNKLGTQKFKTQVMRIFPNPNNGSFEIQSTDMPIQSVVLYDVTGNKVFEKQGFQSKNIEITFRIHSGVYFVNVNEMGIQKILVINQ